MKRQNIFSIAYIVIAAILLIVAPYWLSPETPETISYSQFKTLLKGGRLNDVLIGETEITGMIQPQGLKEILTAEKLKERRPDGLEKPLAFRVVRVDDRELTAELESAGVSFKGEVSSGWLSLVVFWILPIVVIFALWMLVASRFGPGGGLMQIGKSKAKVYIEQSTGVTFADVEGIDEAEEELIEIVEFLKHPEKYQRLGGHLPKGVLLVGPPGTGKTLLARAVAGEAGVPFFSISGSDFVEMFVGVGAARVRDLFAQAAEHAPSIIFIDELDALGKARGINMLSSHDEREQTLNQLLAEMDGFDPNKNVIMMAATNRPEILDPALLRPGRFDRQVLVDRPDVRGRERILQLHARKIKMAPTVDLAALAARTPGFVGADLANIVNEAALLAARQGKEMVENDDFDEAIERVVAGLQKKSRVMSAKEKKTVAYHESGHALVAELVPGADPVSKVSIIPRGIAALGYTQQTPTEDRYLLTRSELLARIHVLLGGRVAEEIVFDDVSTGAQNDLQRATEIARTMVTQFGMSDKVGLVSLGGPRTPLFLPVPVAAAREYSDQTAALIDAEVKRILADVYEKVKQTLAGHRAALEELAQLLLKKEVVDRAELQDILERARRQPATAAEGSSASGPSLDSPAAPALCESARTKSGPLRF